MFKVKKSVLVPVIVAIIALLFSSWLYRNVGRPEALIPLIFAIGFGFIYLRDSVSWKGGKYIGRIVMGIAVLATVLAVAWFILLANGTFTF